MNIAKSLFTEAQYELLIKNGSDTSVDKDYPPVAKLFMVNTTCVWLISELDPDAPNIAFGLCDLGMGFPEIGYVDLREIDQAQNAFRFLVRDTAFEGKYPLSVYAHAARYVAEITEEEEMLQRADRYLKL